MPKIITKPSEKAVFLIATFGVTASIIALLFVPPVQVEAASGASPTSQPTSRPTSQPTSRPAAQTSVVSVNEAASSETSFSPQSFPTEVYGSLLDTYLENAEVDYKGLSNKGKKDLELLVSHIANTNPDELKKLPEAAYIAWYIDAYNILTLKTIVDHYPIDSILRDITDPWDQPFTVANQPLTLNQIEHDILRKQDAPMKERQAFVDPRLHFAVNCASIGCPVLQGEPFTADNLEELYSKGALEFAQDPTRLRFEGDTLYLSQLMDWYGDDFKLHYADKSKELAKKLKSNGIENPEKIAAVAWFFSEILDGPTAERLRSGDYDLQWIEYDWDLNGQG